MDYLIQGLILLVLLYLSGYFSSSETALTTVSRIKMKTLANAGDKRAALVLRITDQKSKMLSAILIGNNIVNLSASSLATSMAIKAFGSFGAGIATGILTFLILIFGEITPKNAATLRSNDIARRDARFIWSLMYILTPVIFIVNSISIFILRLRGVKNEESGDALTNDEIRTLVDYSEEKGTIELNERTFIHNIFDFSESMVSEIMVPRIDISAVDVNWSYDKIVKFYQRERKTRIPVYEGGKDNVIGILNMKDLIEIKDPNSFSVRKYMREPFYTYEQKNTADLFTEMRSNSISMAIILDEYGDVAGLVTLEDLLEELVGEIRDEYDVNEEDDIIRINDTEFVVLGSANLEDLNDLLPLGFESEDYDTLGGYLTGLFDHFPKTGETYVTGTGVILSVAKTAKRRIIKVRIKFPNSVELPDDEELEANN